MVDLCVWSTWLEGRTGRGLMGVQLPVLTSEPAINSSERWLRELMFWKLGSMATEVPCINVCLLGCVSQEEIHLSRREFLYHGFWESFIHADSSVHES